MVESTRVEIRSNAKDEFHTQEAGNVNLVIRNQESLSGKFNVEIDAWARQALAANGFGDY